jgi:hypothetical protein
MMENKISRRELLVGAAGASCVALTGVPARLDAAAAANAPASNAAAAATIAAADSGRILPLTCTSDVIIPPPGRSFMKFSYDFPEPSVEFGGLRISFRVHTFENTYG